MLSVSFSSDQELKKCEYLLVCSSFGSSLSRAFNLMQSSSCSLSVVSQHCSTLGAWILCLILNKIPRLGLYIMDLHLSTVTVTCFEGGGVSAAADDQRRRRRV